MPVPLQQNLQLRVQGVHLIPSRVTSPKSFVTLFWQRPCTFSHWTPSALTVNKVSYVCMEQLIIAEMAHLFKGDLAWQQINHAFGQSIRTQAS